MNVYDFDDTIYNGDSSAQFYIFCLKKQPFLIRLVPYQAYAMLLYLLKQIDKTTMKTRFYCYMKHIDTDKRVSQFWDKNFIKIKSWYNDIHNTDDVIISASPEFLLKPPCDRLGIKYLLGSVVDKNTGKYTGVNCWGEEKVRRFYEAFPNGVINDFYSDSLSDTPLFEIAKAGYIVKGNELIKYSGS